MEDLGYAKDYKYAHSYPGNFVKQQFMPDSLQGAKFWTPCDNASEAKMYELHSKRWNQD